MAGIEVGRPRGEKQKGAREIFRLAQAPLGHAREETRAHGFAALVVISFLIPADTVRDSIKAEIRAVTGLDPVLRGNAAVSLFPRGEVTFEDVALGDSATGAPAITVEELTADDIPSAEVEIEEAPALVEEPVAFSTEPEVAEEVAEVEVAEPAVHVPEVADEPAFAVEASVEPELST